VAIFKNLLETSKVDRPRVQGTMLVGAGARRPAPDAPHSIRIDNDNNTFRPVKGESDGS